MVTDTFIYSSKEGKKKNKKTAMTATTGASTDFSPNSPLSFSKNYEEMTTHSSVLAWRIPGTGEPSGLPSMGSHRVGHD